VGSARETLAFGGFDDAAGGRHSGDAVNRRQCIAFRSPAKRSSYEIEQTVHSHRQTNAGSASDFCRRQRHDRMHEQQLVPHTS